MLQKKNKNKIGILGGTFDPPHIGHLHISKVAIKKLKLNKVIWLITKQNPLKSKAYLSTKSESDAIAVVCTAPHEGVAAGDKGIYVECHWYSGDAQVRWKTGKKSGDTRLMRWHQIKLADAQTA